MLSPWYKKKFSPPYLWGGGEQKITGRANLFFQHFRENFFFKNNHIIHGFLQVNYWSETNFCFRQNIGSKLFFSPILLPPPINIKWPLLNHCCPPQQRKIYKEGRNICIRWDSGADNGFIPFTIYIHKISIDAVL